MNISLPDAGAAGSTHIWSGASPAMSPTQKMSDLFGEIDRGGSGSITTDQFKQAFKTMNPPPSFQAAGADSVWTQLDPSGTGSVSQQDFVSKMTSLMKQLRGNPQDLGSAAGAQALAQEASNLDALGGASAAPGADGVGSIFNTVA